MTTNYNIPPTRAAGYVITEADWDTDVRDNLKSFNDLIGHPDGGHQSFTDGGILLGSGTGVITAMAVLAKGSMVVGDGTTDPQELVVGANGTYPTADSGEALGIKWATPATITNPEDIMKYA